MWFSDHWWRTEFRWLAGNNLAKHDGNTHFKNYPHDFTLPFLVVPFPWSFLGGGVGRVFFLIKFELIPLCSHLLACNNSPLKHEQWEKKMLSSLPFPLTPSGCGSSFTSYLRASGDHFSHSQIASLWHIYYTALMNSSLSFTTGTPQPDFNCLRHRPQYNIHLSDLAGIQPLADYSWLPQSFATI